MDTILALIPSAAEVPESARKSQVRKDLLAFAFGRRNFLKAFGVGFVAVGANALNLLPFGPRAAALPTTHGACADFAPWDNSHWGECNPYASGNPQIGGGFCDGDNYHRVDNRYDPDYVTEYFRRTESCYYKNAWVWRISNNPNQLPNYRDRRCSDGWYRVRRRSDGVIVQSQTMSVCEHLLPISGSPVTPDTT